MMLVLKEGNSVGKHALSTSMWIYLVPSAILLIDSFIFMGFVLIPADYFGPFQVKAGDRFLRKSIHLIIGAHIK